MLNVNKITTSLRIVEKLLRRGQRKAKNKGVSFSAYIAELIERDLKVRD